MTNVGELIVENDELRTANVRLTTEINNLREMTKRKRDEDDENDRLGKELKRTHDSFDDEEKGDDDEESIIQTRDRRICRDCQRERPMSSFRERVNHKNKKTGVIEPRVIHRTKCNSCRSRKYKKKKVANSTINRIIRDSNFKCMLNDDIKEEDEPQFYPDGESSGEDHVVKSILYMGRIYNPDLAIGKV